ncbi:hypothetical protein KR018_011389 [Drosophila ironensis]|nr:hypothetical protein KR018_011389 [Drosophila ironensis]
MIPTLIVACWERFVSGFHHMMNIAGHSPVLQILFSCTMAVVFIIHVKSGHQILNTVKNRKTVKNQSPIHILSNRLTVRKVPVPLQWTFYGDVPLGCSLKNNGSTVILKLLSSSNRQPFINGGDLEGDYQFVEACFKWGIHRSEHSIDDHRFSVEVQALHRCPNNTGPFEYLTVSHLFMVMPTRNGPLKEIAEHLRRIQNAGSSIEVPPFRLNLVIMPFIREFYTYYGTYNNGDVTLATTWLINSHVHAVSSYELAQFRQLCGPDRNRINSNVLPEQPLGLRCVQFHP